MARRVRLRNVRCACLFPFLADSIQHASIKVYLSAIRSLHVEQGFPGPMPNCLRLQRVMREIKRFQGSPVSSRLPITDSVMTVIRQALKVTSPPTNCMFWAACTLSYFGFLRSTESTVSNLASLSSTIHLSVADIAVDCSLVSSCLRVRIRASKASLSQGLFYIHWSWKPPFVCRSCNAGLSFPPRRFPWTIVPPAEWIAAVSCHLD